MSEKDTAVAPASQDSILEYVTEKIDSLVKTGELKLHPDYAVGNALKAGWLAILGTQDKNYKPAVEVCKKASIQNALFRMIIQGLNPDKSQCYFVVHADKLTMMRSYFGAEVVARRIRPDIAPGEYGVVCNVVFKGDKFSYRTARGRKEVTEYETSFENQETGIIRGAYCELWSTDGELIACDVMTWQEILNSWKMSPAKPIDDKGNLKPDSKHAQFPVAYSKRTMINRILKPLINTSTDKHLLESIKEGDDEAAEAIAASEIAREANQGEVIDIPVEQSPVETPPANEPTPVNEDQPPF